MERTPGRLGRFFIAADPGAASDDEALFGAGGQATALPATIPLPGATAFATGLEAALDPTFTELGCVNGFNLSSTDDTLESTCFGDTSRVFIAGFREFDLSLDITADVRPAADQDDGQEILLQAWCTQSKFYWYFLPDAVSANVFMVAGAFTFENFEWDAQADGLVEFSLSGKAFNVVKGYRI